MSRFYIDCRGPNTDCTVALSADSVKELLEAAVQHAVAVHGDTDSPEFRKELTAMIKPGTPPVKVPSSSAA